MPWLLSRLLTLGVVLLLVTVLSFLGSWWWILDLFTHFRLYYALAGLVLLIPLLAARRWKGCAVVAVPALVNSLLVSPLFLPNEVGGETGSTWLHLMAFNVHTANGNKQEVLQYLQESGAELIFLQEIDDQWHQALSEWKSEYRLVVSRPQQDNFGVALLSRIDLLETKVYTMPSNYNPSILIWVDLEGELVILATHTVPPVSAQYAAWRDEHIDQLTEWAQGRDMAMVIGDLNATRWSRPVARFLSKTGWRSSMEGFGYQASWPMGIGSPVEIPIDDALISPRIKVMERRLGPALGSDHRPLLLTVVRR